MADAERIETGRLAMRVEGTMWNAYFALPGTMEGAVFLGGGATAAVADPFRKAAFMTLMTDFVKDLLEERTGLRPEMSVRPAPESERGGNA